MAVVVTQAQAGTVPWFLVNTLLLKRVFEDATPEKCRGSEFRKELTYKASALLGAIELMGPFRSNLWTQTNFALEELKRLAPTPELRAAVTSCQSTFSGTQMASSS